MGILKDIHFPARDQCTMMLSRGKGVKPTLIETKSAKYPERIASVPYDGMLLVEAAQMPYIIFENSLGRVAQTDGWILMSGTLESESDWYVEKSREYLVSDNADGGATYSLPSWENLTEFPGGFKDPKLQRFYNILGHDKFMERFGGQIRPLKGLVLPEFKYTRHVGKFDYRPGVDVQVWVDPGYYPSAYAVLFVQVIQDEVFIFDEIYVQNVDTPEIITMVAQKPYYRAIVGGAIDIYAKQRVEKTVIWEQWKDNAQLRLKLDMNKVKVSEGVTRARQFFTPHPLHGTVKIHIDEKCVGLISELGGCKSPFADEGRGAWKKKMDRNGNVLSDEPSKSNCDSSKALIYGLVSQFGLAARKVKSTVSYYS